MANPGSPAPGPGLVADLDRLEREVRDAQRAVGETTGTAEAADGLLQATVTGRGELVELDLDPRVYRELAPEALAEEIRTAVNEARTLAQRNALDAFSAALPDLPVDGDDPMFGPLLGELGRHPGGGAR